MLVYTVKHTWHEWLFKPYDAKSLLLKFCIWLLVLQHLLYVARLISKISQVISQNWKRNHILQCIYGLYGLFSLINFFFVQICYYSLRQEYSAHMPATVSWLQICCLFQYAMVAFYILVNMTVITIIVC